MKSKADRLVEECLDLMLDLEERWNDWNRGDLLR